MYTVDLKYSDIDFVFSIRPSKDDFIEFLWEKEKQVPFNPYLYKYDDKDGELYRKLEDDWLHNKLDEFGIVHSPEFHKYLTDKYEDLAYSRYYDEQEKIAEAMSEYYRTDIDEDPDQY